MGGGGGKGDKTESTVKLPPAIEALATRNLQQAEKAGQIGYTPYQGPTMAALNPAEIANMQNNTGMANAFGLQTADPTKALPPVQTFAGGIQGYSPMALYNQAVGQIAPGQAAAIKSFVMNPQTGAAPTVTAKRKSSGSGSANKAPQRRRRWDWGMNGGVGGYKYY